MSQKGGNKLTYPMLLALSVVAVFGVTSTNANITNAVTSLFKGFSSNQGEAFSDAILITSSQESVTPFTVGSSMKDAAKATVAVLAADRIASSIANSTLETMPGYGYSDSLQCLAYAEKTSVQSITQASEDSALNDTLDMAIQYTTSKDSKQSVRVADHLEKYCDISEVEKGVCLPSFDGVGSADSNYVNISKNDHLSTEERQAAYAYMRNMSDPTPIKIGNCESIACLRVSDVQRAHGTFSSLSHNMVAEQISARTTQDFRNIGTDLNIKLDSDGNPKKRNSSKNGSAKPGSNSQKKGGLNNG